MAKPSLVYYSLINSFMQEFFGGRVVDFGIQKRFKNKPADSDPDWNPARRALTQEDLTNHFFFAPTDRGSYIEGSLGFLPAVDPSGNLRFCCFDLDRKEEIVRFHRDLRPNLEKDGFEFILEYGGDDDNPRQHVWAKTLMPPGLFKTYISQKLGEIGSSFQEFDEVYGANKLNNWIRLFLGPHLRRNNKRYPLEFRGVILETVEEALQAFLDAKVVTASEIEPKIVKQVEKARTVNLSTSRLTYTPLNLPLAASVPTLLEPVFKNCQAINYVLDATVNDKFRFLDKKGEMYHTGGLWLGRLAMFNDSRLSRKTRKPVMVGEEWFFNLLEEKRSRDYESHNWWSNVEQVKQNPDRYFPSCQAWEEKFDKCQGCPFKGEIKSPKQFIYADKVERKALQEVKLVTPDEIRNTTFKRVEKRLDHLLENGLRETILLASPQGSGKSYFASEMAAKYAKAGFNVLIAVPFAELALEQKERLEKLGVDPFILMSHKNIFEKGLADFECPDFDEIRKLHDLGVPSSAYKKQFCEKCPFADRCPYPKQYTQVKEPEHQVVIIQHAHFSCQEVIFDLMEKKFSLMIIDETFIKNCYTSIKPKSYEIEYLKELDFGWANKLVKWLKGDEAATGELKPSVDDLKVTKQLFDSIQAPWTIPQYIRYYNQKRLSSEITGIEIVYEIPDTPVKLLTDATPPVKLIEAVTGMENIVTYGSDEVIDIKALHPGNEVVQLLDSKATVWSMENGGFEDILMKIAELIEMKFENKKVLFTAYRRYYKKIIEFFKEHEEEFPSILKRLILADAITDSTKINTDTVVLDCMDKGTNFYKDFDVQFLWAGVFYTGGDYELDAYKYQAVENYYRQKKGLSIVRNLYPYAASPKTQVPREDYLLTRIEMIGKKKAALVEYPLFKLRLPALSLHKHISDFNAASTQQAGRVRMGSDKPRILYVINSSMLPSSVVTKSVLRKDFIKPFDIKENLW